MTAIDCWRGGGTIGPLRKLTVVSLLWLGLAGCGFSSDQPPAAEQPVMPLTGQNMRPEQPESLAGVDQDPILDSVAGRPDLIPAADLVPAAGGPGGEAAPEISTAKPASGAHGPGIGNEDERYEVVPILMYHVVDRPGQTYAELYVNPADFRAQMQYLDENGYHAVTLNQVVAHWNQGQPLPSRPVVLTFDDGYPSVYSQAFPILKDFAFTATLFINTAKLDKPNGLTTARLAEMVGAGFEVGSHTINHLDLTGVSDKVLAREVAGSREGLAQALGRAPVSFAYPAGQADARVTEAVYAAGYLVAVTTEYGLAAAGQDPLRLQRIRINGSDGYRGFVRKLAPYREYLATLPDLPPVLPEEQ